jgi:hypothetical protein
LELLELHGFMRGHVIFTDLEARAGQKWGLHETQAAACYFSRYIGIRKAILKAGPAVEHCAL